MSSTVESKAGNVSRMINRLSQDQHQLFSKSDISVRKGATTTNTTQNNKKPKYCKARYSYIAEQQDELTFDEGIFIEAIEDVEDGWMRGKIMNSKKSGLFPTNFVSFLSEEEIESELGIKSVPSSTSFTSSSTTTTAAAAKPQTIEERKDEKKVADQLPAKNQQPLIVTSARRVPSTSSSAEILEITENKYQNKEKSDRAIVLYAYSATQPDELDLFENTTVIVLDKHCADEGWYLGEYQGKRGVFPSNFVQLIEKPASSAAPPTPPPVKPPKPHMSSNKELSKPLISSTTTTELKSTKSADTSHENNELPTTKSTTFASESFGTKHSNFESSTKSTVETPTKPIGFGGVTANASSNNAPVPASSKIKSLQNNLFGGRQPPKPGDKPLVRPVTTIIDNYTGPESDSEKPLEKEREMQHLTRDRPRQANKRPPSMMPVITTSESRDSLSNGTSNGLATTNFPVKESPPVVTQKPALTTSISNAKKQHSENESKESKPIYKVTHTEAVLSPSKKSSTLMSATSSTSSAAAAASSGNNTFSPLPIVSEDEKFTIKHYNQIAKNFNELLKELSNVKQELQQLRNQTSS
jgi:hypothetical protein